METKLNYAIWRKVGRKKESINGNIIVNGQFTDKDFSHRAFEAIMSKHPGWMVMGFCPADNK